MGLQSDFFEKGSCIYRRSKNRNIVSVVDHMITAWDRNLIPALNGTEKHIAFECLCNARNRHTIQSKLRQHLEFQKLYPSSGKGIDLNGRGEAEQTGNLLGCCQFRINDHVYTETFFDKADLIAVNWIADSGNCLAVSCFLGDQTAKKVHFVRASHCDENVCLVNSGFHKRIDAGTISYNSHCINVILQ